MALIKWDPFKGMEKFFDDDFFSMLHVPKGWEQATDIYEEKGDLVVKTQIAGVDIKDINIEIEDNYLRIFGEQKEEKEEKKKNYYMKQMKSGSFSKSILLPKEVFADKALATLERGILEIRFPLKPEKKSADRIMKIKVKGKK